MQTIEVNGLSEYAAIVSKKAEELKPVWFRGVSDAAAHRLTPSLYRHPQKTEWDELKELELTLMATFRDRAPPFAQGVPSDATELLFFMQHHGAPTRLLDVSENPFTALFFALERALWEQDANAVDAAVWMIDPIELNKMAFANNDGSDRILSHQDDLLNAYKPEGPAKTSGKLPVAMYGVHNSRRIVAQRGVFLLFGTSTAAMDETAQLTDHSTLLTKIIIKANAKKDIAKALFSMGVTDSVIYPDLDGLGREIKSQYEFWRR